MVLKPSVLARVKSDVKREGGCANSVPSRPMPAIMCL